MWYRRMKVLTITHFLNTLSNEKTILFIDETGFNRKNSSFIYGRKKMMTKDLQHVRKEATFL